MMRYLLLVLLLFPSNEAFPQETKLKKVYFGKTKNVKEEYHVLKKNKTVKHGEYTAYRLNGRVKVEGQYRNNQKDGQWYIYFSDGNIDEIQIYQAGKKVGIWQKYIEDGKVIKRFDYDRNEELEVIEKKPLKPQFNIYIAYPPMAREEGIEGTVKFLYSLEEGCVLTDVKVLESVGYGCDEEAIKALKSHLKLTKKHLPEKCGEATSNEEFSVDFRLN